MPFDPRLATRPVMSGWRVLILSAIGLFGSHALMAKSLQIPPANLFDNISLPNRTSAQRPLGQAPFAGDFGTGIETVRLPAGIVILQDRLASGAGVEGLQGGIPSLLLLIGKRELQVQPGSSAFPGGAGVFSQPPRIE